MMRFDGPEVAAEFKTVFGATPTAVQMRCLLKFAKHIRGRCRSNAALKNYLVRNFPGLSFGEKQVIGNYGKPYTALTIADRGSDAAPVVDDESDDE